MIAGFSNLRILQRVRSIPQPRGRWITRSIEFRSFVRVLCEKMGDCLASRSGEGL